MVGVVRPTRLRISAKEWEHRALAVLADEAWLGHLRAKARSGPRTCHCGPPGSSAILLQCHGSQAANANRGEMGPACDDADIDPGTRARWPAADGADANAEDADAHGLLLLGRVAKIARPRVLLSPCRGIRVTASAEVACGWQASSAAEIHLLLEPSI